MHQHAAAAAYVVLVTLLLCMYATSSIDATPSSSPSSPVMDASSTADAEAELAALETLIVAQRAKLQLLQKQQAAKQRRSDTDAAMTAAAAAAHAALPSSQTVDEQTHDANEASIPPASTHPSASSASHAYMIPSIDDDDNGWLPEIWSHDIIRNATAATTLSLRITRTQLLNMARSIPLPPHERHKLVANLLLIASTTSDGSWCVMIYDIDAPLSVALLTTITRTTLINNGWLGTPPSSTSSRITSIATSSSPDTFILLAYNDGSMVTLSLSPHVLPSSRVAAARRTAAYEAAIAAGDDIHHDTTIPPQSTTHLPLKILMIAVVAPPRAPSVVIAALTRTNELRSATRISRGSGAAGAAGSGGGRYDDGHHDDTDDDSIGYNTMMHDDEDDDNDDVASAVLYAHIYQRRNLLLFIGVYEHGIIRTFGRTGAPRAVIQTSNTSILATTLAGTGSQNMIIATSSGIMVLRITHRTARDGGDREAIVDYCTHHHGDNDGVTVTGLAMDVNQPSYMWMIDRAARLSVLNTKLISHSGITCSPRTSLSLYDHIDGGDDGHNDVHDNMRVVSVRGYVLITSSSHMYAVNTSGAIGTFEPSIVMQRVIVPVATTVQQRRHDDDSASVWLLSSYTPYMDSYVHIIHRFASSSSQLQHHSGIAVVYRSLLPFFETPGINVNALRAPLFIGSLMIVVAYQFWKRKKASPSLDFVNDPLLRRELEEFERFDRERKAGIPSSRRDGGGGAGGISGATPSARVSSSMASSAAAATHDDRFAAKGDGVHSYDIDQPISDEEYVRLLRRQHDKRHGSGVASSSSNTMRAAINGAINHRGMQLPRTAAAAAAAPRVPPVARQQHDRALPSSASSSVSSTPPIVTSYDIDRPIMDDEADDNVESDGEAHAYGDAHHDNASATYGSGMNDDDTHNGGVAYDDGEGDMAYDYEPEWEHPNSYLVGARAPDGSPVANAPRHPFDEHDDDGDAADDDDEGGDDTNNNDVTTPSHAHAPANAQSKKDQ